MTMMTELDVRATAGVDTHKGTHVAAALDQQGRLLDTEGFPATTVGSRRLAPARDRRCHRRARG